MPNRFDIFPSFRKTRSGDLYALLKKDRMFHLKFTGNRGSGFEFRIYETRTTVLKHQGTGEDITFEEFKNGLTSVFGEYLGELTMLLPQELRLPPGDYQDRLKSPDPTHEVISTERAVKSGSDRVVFRGTIEECADYVLKEKKKGKGRVFDYSIDTII